MEETIKRILKWKSGVEAGPTKIQLNPTNRCNIKCRFCWLRDFDSSGANYEEVETSRYFEIIEEAAGLGVESVEITGGGEPSCREDMTAVMKKIKAHGLYGELITNGTLLAENSIEDIVEMGWDRIVFSLDGPDAETNDYLRGADGAFVKTTAAIKLLSGLKTKTKRDKPEVCIHFVLCNKNHDKIEKMFKLAHNLGCNNLFIEPMVVLALGTGAGRDLLVKEGDRKQLLLELEKARDFAREHHFKTNLEELKLELVDNVNKMDGIIMGNSKQRFAEPEDAVISIPCYRPWYQMVMRPWGVVGPCCMFDNVGDDAKEKSLKDIWLGEDFTRIRNEMRNGKLPDFCSKCNPGQVQENMKIRKELQRHAK